MTVVRRIYVEKRAEYDVYSGGVFADLRDNLGIAGLVGVRTLCRYDVQGLSDEYYAMARDTVFAELPVDHVYEEELPVRPNERLFAVEYLPGQYDQRADSAAQCVQLLTHGARPVIASARIYVLEGNIGDDDFERIKSYCINPVDSREASLYKPVTLDMIIDTPDDVATLDGFISTDDSGADELRRELGLAMKREDILFCQRYFRDTEKRDPTITEIRVLDTYWSDHCRHTTFLTSIKNVEIEDAPLNTPVKEAFETYKRAREQMYGGRGTGDRGQGTGKIEDGGDVDPPISLMDIALMGMRELRKKGALDDLDVSGEINACSIVVPAIINGQTEEWLVMFKNETHNHPTEIEPFGGAATCLGGAIRDPLSGRSYVYQAMRVTGSGDPRAAVKETLPGKLPQRKITTLAARGYSSYGNQIGLATGLVSEIYHDGYAAKRMEIGAVVGAAPRSNVVRHEPKAGDIVVLLGGRTGRDGCGGATGSSKEHTEESIQTCSAEVQKGNPPTERKIQRLFRDPEVSRMIRRCNDFGAGGVSVAIGELAAGLAIDLDAVPKKYEGLDGTELAISESQERMAVVIDRSDLELFEAKVEAENLESAVVAVVTDDRRLKMTWRGKTIVDISRDFIDTNGVTQETEVFVEAPAERRGGQGTGDGVQGTGDGGQGTENPVSLEERLDLMGNIREEHLLLWRMVQLDVCSQRGMVEMFDSTVGASTVFLPFGGKYQSTPIEAMVAKLPVIYGETATGTAMSYGFDPYLSSWSPFHGAVYAVIHSVAKIVAVGGDHRKIRLSLQEYFEKLGDNKARWGKPFAALLGAYYAQVKLGIPAIGGKDSMSGTFKDMHVPPTLVSFALAPVDVSKVISPEFKGCDSPVAIVSIPRDKYNMPDFDVIARCYDAVRDGIASGLILSAHTIGRWGYSETIPKMCFGNRIGFMFENKIVDKLTEMFNWWDYGSLIIELDKYVDFDENNILGLGKHCRILGKTTFEPIISYRDDYEVTVDIDELYRVWTEPLEKVFPIYTPVCTNVNKDAETPINTNMRPFPKSAGVKIAKPRVLISVFPGTNCEYDSARQFKRVGAECDFFLLKNMRPGDIEESIKIMSEKIANSQILMIPGGFSAGDEPDGSGKFVAAFFRNPRIKDAVTELLNNRDGLILGICNGFQALIKLGLVPYGEICDLDENSSTLTFNTIGRHISRIAYTKINSVNSPWLSNVCIDDIHAVPISHGEGRFVASPDQLKSLFASGQIATRYVNADCEFDDTVDGNYNGSYAAIEGILSPDGRVFGKMGHSERIGEHVAKNIYGNKDQKLFESGVAYFR